MPRAILHGFRKPPSGTIRLWTIQPQEVWDRLRAQGTLYVDPEHPRFLRDFGEFRDSYDWMREQMARRLPGYDGHYPWWAHQEPKPDLRIWKHLLHPGGAPFVRLEMAVPATGVLLSAYGDWHYVLNRWYLAQSDREENEWGEELKRHLASPYQRHSLPEPWESRMRASWERIFDVEERRACNSIQATFERLCVEDVIAVTEFTAAGRVRRGRHGCLRTAAS